MVTQLFWLLLLYMGVGGVVEVLPKSGQYTLGDLVVAFPTHEANAALIDASRSWRRGVRTHIVVAPGLDLHTLRVLGAPHRETYTMSPDYPGHPPAVRHALTPVFAMEAVGADNFKWMLVGDDDTIFVIPAVLRLLNERGLSADDPHLISDFNYVCKNPKDLKKCSGSHSGDPRCLPCGKAEANCPCRLPRDCTKPDWRTQSCKYQPRIMPYGGAGVIFSVGMLRLLTKDPEFYMPLVFRSVRKEEPWGDRMFAEGPRQLGYGFTNLGGIVVDGNDTSIVVNKSGTRHFFGTYAKFNDANSPEDMLRRMETAARDEPAVFQQTVSFHMRTSRLQSLRKTMSGNLLPSYRRVVDLLLRAHGELGCGC